MLLQSPGHQTYLSRQVERSSNSASLEMKSFFTKWRAKSEKQTSSPYFNHRSLGRLCHHHSPKLPRDVGGSTPLVMRVSNTSWRSFKAYPVLAPLALSSINWSNYASHRVGMTQLNPLRLRQVRFARAVAKGGNVARSSYRRLCGCISAYVQYSRLLKLSQGVNSHQPTLPLLGNPPSSAAYLFLYVCQTVVKEC